MTMSRDYRSRDTSYDADDHFDRPARAGVAGGLPIRALELALRHPLTTAACALSVVMIGVISGNALVNQPSRHPNPLFSTRAPVETQAPRVQAPVNGVSPTAAPITLPRPRPVSALDEPQRMQELQTALRDRGFYSGPVDGVLGPATVEAVRAFERRLGVTPTGEPNEMTLAVLKTLPVVDPMATGSLPPAAARSPAAPVRQAAAHAAPQAQLPPPSAPSQPRRGVADGVGYPVATDVAVDVETEATVAAGAVRRAAREPLAQGGNERHQKIQRALVAAGYGPLRADGRWDEKSQAAAKRWEVDHGLAQTGRPSENLVYGLMLEPTRVRR